MNEVNSKECMIVDEVVLEMAKLCVSYGVSADEIKTLLRVTEEEWDDRTDEYSDKIKAAHPTRTKEYGKHTLAMRLVSSRKSKGELVDLVNWLLQKIDITTL